MKNMASAVKIGKEIKRKNSIAVSLFGEAKFSESQLPTYDDAIKHYLHSRSALLLANEGREEPAASEVAKQVATALREIWIKSSIPTVSQQQILARVKKCHDSHRTLMKTDRKRKDFKHKMKEFNAKNNNIFDITACKCINFTSCSCSKDNIVPIEESPFLTYQRTTRKMFIQGIDFKTTKKLQKRTAQEKQEKYQLEEYMREDKPSTEKN